MTDKHQSSFCPRSINATLPQNQKKELMDCVSLYICWAILHIIHIHLKSTSVERKTPFCVCVFVCEFVFRNVWNNIIYLYVCIREYWCLAYNYCGMWIYIYPKDIILSSNEKVSKRLNCSAEFVFEFVCLGQECKMMESKNVYKQVGKKERSQFSYIIDII